MASSSHDKYNRHKPELQNSSDLSCVPYFFQTRGEVKASASSSSRSSPYLASKVSGRTQIFINRRDAVSRVVIPSRLLRRIHNFLKTSTRVLSRSLSEKLKECLKGYACKSNENFGSRQSQGGLFVKQITEPEVIYASPILEISFNSQHSL